MWGKWRGSIIEQWSLGVNDFKHLTLKQVRGKTGAILELMDFPANLWLELYWICCVVSDYVFDDYTTYENIVVPSWLPSLYAPVLSDYKVDVGVRAYPPPILDEEDIDLELRRLFGGGTPPEKAVTILRTRNRAFMMFLPGSHELHEVLRGLQGRPKLHHRPGRQPHYSDRIAVKCAALKYSGLTYVQVAEKLGLPRTKPYSSLQSDAARWLVKRGEDLLITIHKDTSGAESS